MSVAVLFRSMGLIRAAVTVIKKLRVSTQVQAAVVSRILFWPDSFMTELMDAMSNMFFALVMPAKIPQKI